MPNVPLDVARRVAERARVSIEEAPFVIEKSGRTIPITVSIGLAERGRDAEADALYQRADKALYRSKAEGRNRVTSDAA